MYFKRRNSRRGIHGGTAGSAAASTVLAATRGTSNAGTSNAAATVMLEKARSEGQRQEELLGQIMIPEKPPVLLQKPGTQK